jgi:hypothetical protein
MKTTLARRQWLIRGASRDESCVRGVGKRRPARPARGSTGLRLYKIHPSTPISSLLGPRGLCRGESGNKRRARRHASVLGRRRWISTAAAQVSRHWYSFDAYLSGDSLVNAAIWRRLGEYCPALEAKKKTLCHVIATLHVLQLPRDETLTIVLYSSVSHVPSCNPLP